MDWKKVISELADRAEESLGNAMAVDMPDDMRMMLLGVSMTMSGLGAALEAGLERQAYTLSKEVTGGQSGNLPAGTIVYDYGAGRDILMAGTVFLEVTLNEDGSGPSFYIEAPTLHRYTKPPVKS